MRRRVVIEFEIEMEEYMDTEDTDRGAVELAVAMLSDEADFPDEISVECNGIVMKSPEDF